MNRNLSALLNPSSIAVVGASSRGNRGSTILQNLRRLGSTARIYVVHPRESVVAGFQAFPSLDALPECCDFVAAAVGADTSLSVLEQAVEQGAKAGLIIASGFGEGGAGAARRDRLVELTRRSELLLCGPNCYGIVNVATGFAAYSGELVDPFTPGRIALVMQSGALTHSLTDSAVGRGLGLSHLITTGNELSVTLGEYVEALADDSSVGVIGVFLEGLRDADSFAAAALKAQQNGKPVVALAVGKSELGQRAALAHTGAIAGGGSAMSGFLRRWGVIQTADLDEFRETLLLFGSGVRPGVGGAALATISGGGAGLLADVAERAGLEMAQLTAQSADRLADLLPDFATVANPLDVTGAAVENPALLATALEALTADENVAVAAFALNVPGGSNGQQELYREQARILGELAAVAAAPLVAISLVTGPLDAQLVETLRRHGLVLLTGAGPALAALGSWLDWHRRWTGTGGAPTTLTPLALDPGVISGADALGLLTAADIAVPDSFVAVTAADAIEGWDLIAAPVVAVKAEAAGLAHKTDIGGVVLGVASPADLSEAIARIGAAVAEGNPQTEITGFLIQAQITAPSVECLVGIVRDPQVGLVLSVAAGGVLAELGGPALTTPVPASAEDIEYLIDSSALGRLLDGYRGAPRADRGALTELVVRFSMLAARIGSALQAAELNPVLVLADGCGAVAVDALWILDPVGTETPSARLPVVQALPG